MVLQSFEEVMLTCPPTVDVATPFLTSYITNTLFLLAYSYIFNSELDDRRFLAISSSLWILQPFLLADWSAGQL